MVLRNHLYPDNLQLVKRDGRMKERIDQGHSSNALVPWPGTFEHREWMEAIRRSNSIEALEVLQDWMSGFFKSGIEMEVALRRLRVLNAHLSAPAYHMTIKEVW